MIVTVLEGRVAADKWEVLTESYGRAITSLDAGIEERFLTHSMSDPAVWHIFTMWADRAALQAMRDSGETPRGILIFRSAGAEPTLTVHEVVARAGA